MSIHYAKYASTGYRVEYIGRKRRIECIKTIQVNPGRDQRQRSEALLTDLLFFSPDGTQILHNTLRGVCVWNATRGELIAGPLTGYDESGALSATYSPDGRYIIEASDDGIIRKFDALTNFLVWEREMGRKQIDLSRVVSAAFSPDAKSVVFGDFQGTIVVFNVETGGQDDKPLKGHTKSVLCLSFSSDGQYFASGSDDMTINIWDVDRRKVKISPLKKHTKAVTTVNFSPSGTNVVSGSKDRTILVWDAFTGEVLRKIECGGEVNSVIYSPNELYILVGGSEWMSMWKVDDVTAPPKVFQVDKSILRVAFSPDSSRFMSLNDGRDEIRIWDASWGVEGTETIIEEQAEITSISLSASGNLIVTGTLDGSICLWSVLTGGLVKKLDFSHSVDSVSFCPVNEQLIAFGSRDGTVRLWNVTNGEPFTIGKHDYSVSSVVFSPLGGKHVASGSWDKTIRIWDVDGRELEVSPLTERDSFVRTLAYSPDGTRLASGSADKTVRIWNPETGQLLSTFYDHHDWVNSVAYSSDGLCIVSGSDDKTILFYNAQDDQTVGELITRSRDWVKAFTGHGGSVSSVCFSPDGKRILSGSFDKTARVWGAVTDRSLFLPFGGHTKIVRTVCFFPDGRRFATGSDDGAVRIWTLDTTPNNTNWDLRNNNWVVDKNNKPMMWIPTDLRTRLYSSGCTSILNRSYYLKLKLGTE